MTTLSLRRLGFGAALAAFGLTLASPVLADHWHGRHWHHGYYAGPVYGYGGPVYAPAPYYAPPPVYYPSPGINVVVPLRIR